MEMKDVITLKGSYVIRTWKAGTKELLSESKPIENKIVGSSGYGRANIIAVLGNNLTYGLPITSASIGTGTTAPTDADTDLQTPVTTGIAVTDRAFPTATSVTITFFITSAQLADGTYKEFGIYSNGRLFARSLITPNFSKSGNVDTTIDYTITLN